MFSEGINHGVGLIICHAGCIAVVVVKIGQLLIVMRFKPFILVLGGVTSGAIDYGSGFCDALELFTIVFHTECSEGCCHDHGV